jgi:predicted DsbA family dithiol-disulfide isomerase
MGIRWLAFPLHPETPAEGTSLEELFRERDVDLSAYWARLEQVAAELGLPLGKRTMTYNSRRAHELGKWAETLGKGDEFHLAVFRAYFAEGRNIADMAVLKEIAEAQGLDGRMAAQVLAAGTFQEAVDQDWAYARSCVITVAPTFRVAGQKVVGAQPYQALVDLLRAAGGKRRQ